MSTALATLAGKLAERVGMDSVDPQELITTLRQTAFKGDASEVVKRMYEVWRYCHGFDVV